MIEPIGVKSLYIEGTSKIIGLNAERNKPKNPEELYSYKEHSINNDQC